VHKTLPHIIQGYDHANESLDMKPFAPRGHKRGAALKEMGNEIYCSGTGTWGKPEASLGLRYTSIQLHLAAFSK